MKKLYIGNLSYTTLNEGLAAAFSQAAVINSVEIVRDRMTGRSRGFGFVEVASEADAQVAISMWNGKDLDGRLLVVNEAQPFTPRAKRRIPGSDDEESTSGPEPTNHNDAPPLAEFLCDRPIVEITNGVSIELMKYVRAHPMELRRIDRRRFEELVAEIWSGFGYTVELTQPTRDGGIDVVAVRKTIVEERFLIECKRPDVGHAVGIVPVRSLYGVLMSERATKAILATTAHFSKDAIVFFEDHRWQLEGKDFEGLMEWVDEYVRRRARPPY